MSAIDIVLHALAAAAAAAEAREASFRQETAATAKQLATDRATAFRRLNFMRRLAEIAAQAESAPLAVSGAQDHIRTQFGWDGDSEARSAVLEHLAPIALALHAAAHPPEADDLQSETASGNTCAPALATAVEDATLAEPAAALQAFENWYEQTRASSFWHLFEHYMPETPRVDY